jgi:hypothetical protein
LRDFLYSRRITPESSGAQIMAKSILAVFVGYLLAVTAFVAVYLVMLRFFPAYVPLPGSAPSMPVLALLSTWLLCFGMLGAVVAARIAGRLPFQHGVALAVVTIGLGAIKPLLAPGAEPLWSHLVLLSSGAAGALLGGAIAARRSKNR